jgi:hypothetical protein
LRVPIVAPITCSCRKNSHCRSARRRGPGRRSAQDHRARPVPGWLRNGVARRHHDGVGERPLVLPRPSRPRPRARGVPDGARRGHLLGGRPARDQPLHEVPNGPTRA